MYGFAISYIVFFNLISQMMNNHSTKVVVTPEVALVLVARAIVWFRPLVRGRSKRAEKREKAVWKEEQ